MSIRSLFCAAMILAVGGELQAQQYMRLGGRWVQMASPAPTASCCQGTTSSPSVTLKPCWDGNCNTDCKDCRPVIRPKYSPECECGEQCTKLDSTPSGKITVLSDERKFYKQIKPFEKEIDVPVIVEWTEEYFKFEKKTIDLICCEIEVCVPCERCVKKSRKCETRSQKQKLEARVRTSDGTVDIVALNVPGLPKEWVLRLCQTPAQVKADFGIDIP